MKDLINQVAEMMAQQSKDLAQAWLDQPWNRVDLARAWSAGWVENDQDDPPQKCMVALQVAMLDKRMRSAQ